MSLHSLQHFLQVALIFLVCVQNVDAGTTPLVDLGYAQYQGVVDTKPDITAFKGIRYAAPPTGSLRFQAPAPPSKVAEVQQAFNDPPASEDCLFLNVFSPALNSTAPLPTIVWIHGGGYALGSASQYNGADLVQDSNNKVVAVVIQYRLGLFGFLAGQQVKDDGALNAGLLDQDFALRWVNKNIRKFGGDPDKVTIWGQSAAPKLFRAAITSSTFMPSQYRYNDTIPQTLFNDVAAQAGCNDTKTLDCLRAVDGATLENINLNTMVSGFQGTFSFAPVVDGLFITQSPTDALLRGKVNGDILLSVFNTNEGPVSVNQSAEYNVTEYVRNLFPLFGVKGEQCGGEYLSTVWVSIESDAPLMSSLNAFPAKSYKGEYAIPPAGHGQDIINYFPSFTAFNATLIYNNTAFIDAFTDAFVSFAVNLDPNVKLRPSITPAWPKWSRGADMEMVFNETESGMPDIAPVRTSSALLDRCEFWKSMHHLTGQ
ncbi:Carboxylic ester hydrolase [Mycena venus]|uniref:Carboxylic ester hydrolase n=1 Tax=Mycena venus TaxID=2733690 RepID=A0A8H7DAP6_9AGAR|nr:Carboxylic ester hydrolase [Mycena venus]